MSGWPSGLRRQTQDCPCIRMNENSGPRMWAWVQIPLLTLFNFPFQKCYENKQYKSGLKHARQILSNSKYQEHGGVLFNFSPPYP